MPKGECRPKYLTNAQTQGFGYYAILRLSLPNTRVESFITRQIVTQSQGAQTFLRELQQYAL